MKFEHKRIVEAKIEWQNCCLGSVTSLSEAGPTLKSLLRRSRYLFLDCNGRNGRRGRHVRCESFITTRGVRSVSLEIKRGLGHLQVDAARTDDAL